MAEKQPKQNRPIRFDPDDLALAKKLGIDVNENSRNALKLEISFRMSPEYKKRDVEKKKILKRRSA